MSNRASEDFEQLIERIHRLVESEDSEVTWDDHIADPDNPDQLRQIDITIARQGHLTHVECRIHQSPQNVQWIEELIGRRESLEAHAMIAVSASGFTEGAIKKAETYGIILRTLDTLSEQEISDWGKLTDVEIIYFEFTDTQLTFTVPANASIGEISITDEQGSPLNFRRLFELVMRELAQDAVFRDAGEDAVAHFTAPVRRSLLFAGYEVSGCKIDTYVRRIVRKLSLASVVAYSAASKVDLTENAYVQHFDAEGFEVLQNSDEVAVVIDLTDAQPPPKCLLHTVWFDFGRTVTTRWFKPVGFREAMNYSTDVSIRIEWE